MGSKSKGVRGVPRRTPPRGIVPGTRLYRQWQLGEALMGYARNCGLQLELRVILDSVGIDKLTDENYPNAIKHLGAIKVARM